MALNDWLTRQQSNSGGGGLRGQWLQNQSLWAGQPGELERFGVTTPEADQFRQYLAQMQGLDPSQYGQEITPNNDNDAFYQPSAAESAIVDPAMDYYNNTLRAKYPGLTDQSNWMDMLPYVFAAGAGGMAASALGAFGGAAGGSAPYIGAGGSGAAGATPALLGETALPAIGGTGAGAAAGAFGGYPMPPPQAPPTGIPPGGSEVIGSTALGRLLGLGQTGQDLLSVGGSIAPGILGYLGADKQSDAYRDVANQYLGIGAPYRDTLQQSYQPGFDLMSQPGYGDAFQRMADISARGYSAKFGNPAGSPTAQAGILGDVWNQGYLPALSNYRGQLGQFGGLGLNTAGSASMGGAGVAGGGYDAIGLGLGRAMTPANPYEEVLRNMLQSNQSNSRLTYG